MQVLYLVRQHPTKFLIDFEDIYILNRDERQNLPKYYGNAPENWERSLYWS